MAAEIFVFRYSRLFIKRKIDDSSRTDWFSLSDQFLDVECLFKGSDSGSRLLHEVIRANQQKKLYWSWAGYFPSLSLCAPLTALMSLILNTADLCESTSFIYTLNTSCFYTLNIKYFVLWCFLFSLLCWCGSWPTSVPCSTGSLFLFWVRKQSHIISHHPLRH